MVGKIQKLKDELATLENQTSLIYLEIKDLYQKYLDSLGQAVKKQLILAAYQVCTQAYPEAFLRLSYSQRQTLQETLKNLGNKAQHDLLNHLNQPRRPAPMPNMNIMEKIFMNLAESEHKSGNFKVELDWENLELSHDNNSPITHPEQLMYWCKILEKDIVNQLDHISKEANNALHKADFFPPHVSPQILEMAIQAEEMGQPISGSPNLLNVIIETGQKKKDEDAEDEEVMSKIAKITAIHLRLAEIEFAEAQLSIQHKEIRKVLEKVTQVRKQYHQKQQECTISEAEAAWRSSWYEN